MTITETRIRNFIVDHFLFGEDSGLEADTSFLDEGIIDSTGVLELVHFIEETFGVTVLDEELIPENLDSIRKVAAFLRTKGPQEYLELELPAMMRAGA